MYLPARSRCYALNCLLWHFVRTCHDPTCAKFDIMFLSTPTMKTDVWPWQSTNFHFWVTCRPREIDAFLNFKFRAMPRIQVSWNHVKRKQNPWPCQGCRYSSLPCCCLIPVWHLCCFFACVCACVFVWNIATDVKLVPFFVLLLTSMSIYVEIFLQELAMSLIPSTAQWRRWFEIVVFGTDHPDMPAKRFIFWIWDVANPRTTWPSFSTLSFHSMSAPLSQSEFHFWRDSRLGEIFLMMGVATTTFYWRFFGTEKRSNLKSLPLIRM